uniref:Uncharacterized protein n=1 Tax=Anguilla anguilla TaxID=7936 RepID=A0A0E9WPQ6_ANGAN
MCVCVCVCKPCCYEYISFRVVSVVCVNRCVCVCKLCCNGDISIRVVFELCACVCVSWVVMGTSVLWLHIVLHLIMECCDTF